MHLNHPPTQLFPCYHPATANSTVNQNHWTSTSSYIPNPQPKKKSSARNPRNRDTRRQNKREKTTEQKKEEQRIRIANPRRAERALWGGCQRRMEIADEASAGGGNNLSNAPDAKPLTLPCRRHSSSRARAFLRLLCTS